MITVNKKSIIYLRKLTHESISKCKDALIKSKGDVNKAILLLKNNLNINNNITNTEIFSNEGVVYGLLTKDKKKGILLKINCVTDFVSRNNVFFDFVSKLTRHALSYEDLETLLSSSFKNDGNLSVKDKLLHLSTVLGESINLTGFKVLHSDIVYLYNHHGNKLSSLIGFSHIKNKDELSHDNICKNLCMQVAAMNPIFLSVQDIPKVFLQGQVDLIKSNLLNDNKYSDHHINLIIQGRINKIYKKIVLEEQSYIKNLKINVKEYIISQNLKFKITGFQRLII